MTASSTIVQVTTTATLLWQTSSGVPPDPETTEAGSATAQIFRAGTFNDPVPILIQNNDGTNSVYLGGKNVTDSTGLPLKAGGSLTFNAVGNDALYAIGAEDVNVSVLVMRQ